MMSVRAHFGAFLAAGVFTLAGCGDNSTDGGTPITDLDPVSDLKAYSAGETSVGLVWTASAAVRSTDMQDHEVRVRSVPAGTLLMAFSVAKSETTFIATGLTTGTIYRFDVIVRPTAAADGKGNSVDVGVIWSPARRLAAQASGSPIRVFETANAANPSGLILFKGTAPLATSVKDPSPLSDTLLIDLYAKTESGSILLRSADQYTERALPRSTRFSSVTRAAANLDDPATAPPDTSTYVPENRSILIDNSAVGISRILFFRSHDGNFGRLLVKRQTNGTLIGGISPDRFLELEVSFQSISYNVYSRRR